MAEHSYEQLAELTRLVSNDTIEACATLAGAMARCGSDPAEIAAAIRKLKRVEPFPGEAWHGG